MLSTILIGNNIVNIASASLATIVFTHVLGDAGVSVSTAVMTVIVLIFGEISPKNPGQRASGGVCTVQRPIFKTLDYHLDPD